MKTTILTYDQKKRRVAVFTEHGKEYWIAAKLRHDDQCRNGHNDFSITGEIYRSINGKPIGNGECFGCIHEEIAKHFPELTPFLKWHLCSTDGPMHYLANTLYHVREGKLDFARSSAIWPEATDAELTEPGLEQRLLTRLPKLMQDFQTAVESLGFIY